MKNKKMMSRQIVLAVVMAGAMFGSAAASMASAQAESRVQPRIQAEINTSQPAILKGSAFPLAQSRWDAGRMPASAALHGMEIVFNRSAEQERELEALIKAQQDPSSPEYHKWLTPEQFAERFGMPAADIARVQSWLESEGFKIESVNRAGTGIHFSGTVAQAERAFAAQMHYYQVGGVRHFGPSGAISVPSAIAGVVSNVNGLHDMRPRPLHVRPKPGMKRPRAQYTVETTQGEFALFAPGDLDVVYDVKPLVSGGNDGTGQVITILGQSAIQLGDIANFQQAAGITTKAPTLTLVPNTGDATLNPGCANGGSYQCGGDEGESDLDIEWAGATAPGATINFVYTGGALLTDGTPEYSIWDAYQYAVDNALGNILNFSYGACETEFAQSDITSLEQIGQEAVTQGQSFIAASGDEGSTACAGYTDLSTAQQGALAVNYPASSAYATAVGGTEMTEANATPGSSNPYWEQVPSNSSTGIVLTSALSYIPEVAWNDDDSQYGISASTGGASVYVPRPTWQTGVTGIPSGSMRLVPDVSLYASPEFPGYLFCSSDQYDWDVPDGQSGTCAAGQFYDDVQGSGFFTIAGGTSFASPIFAGMLAIVNQAKGYTGGQGQVNTELYKLASSSTTYASAFHDITTGDNKCSAGSSYCPGGTVGFTTNAGYDEVTGLGSVDLANLVSAWPSSGGTTLVATTTAVTASTTTPTVGTADTFTVTVTPASGTTAPTGTVAVTVDGTAITGSPFALTASGSKATATFPYTFTAAGSHTVSVSYSGDTDFDTSTGSTTVTASSASAVGTTTTVTASSTTPTVGTADSFTVTVTPASGTTAPAGTVAVTVDGTAVSGSPFTLTASGANAAATVPITFTTAGSHTVAAAFSPSDATAFSASNGSTTVTASGGTTAVTTSTALTTSTPTPTVNASVSFTATVTPASGTTAPTGTLAVTVDGTAIAGSPFTLTASGANATATFSYTFTTAGMHQVNATYSGSTGFSTSAGSISVNVQAAGTGSFTLGFNPTTLTVSQGTSGTEALTITPTNYVGTVDLQYKTSNDTALANMCIFAGTGFNPDESITVSSGSTPVTAQLVVDTNGSDCASPQLVAAMRLRGLRMLPRAPRTLKQQAGGTGTGPLAAGAALAGLLLMGCFRKQSRKLRGLAMILLLAAAGLAISACGGGGGSSTPNPAKGTYTITFSGQDSGSSSITASSSFTLTID